MQDPEDLRQYVTTGSQAAFRAIVDRHLPLVYSAAQRRLRDPHQAQDVAQQVFTLLARKAAQLSPRVVLSGWLYRTANLLALEVIRRESRRQQRELQAADSMNAPHLEADLAWRELEPVLDDAMATLSEADRDAVVLRYFENRSLRDVGAALGISDDAAQKRLSRALDKLRAALAQRGKQVASGALVAGLAVGAIQTVPQGLAATIAAGALANAATATSTLALIMSSTTLKTAATITALAGALTGVLIQSKQIRSLREVNAALESRLQAPAAPAAPQNPADAASRSNVAELARLRGELDGLRRAHTEATSENAELKHALQQLLARQKAPADGTESENPELEAVKTLGIAKLNFTKNWGLAFILFANENDGRMPTTFDEAARFMPTPNNDEDGTVWDTRNHSLAVTTTVHGAKTTTVLQSDQYEIMYQGKWDEVKDPAKTILIREKEAFTTPTRDGYSRTYLFADGHSEIHHSADGDFSAWERERIQAAP